MPRLEPDDEERDAQEECQNLFNRPVRVEPLDGGLAEDEADTARNRRSEQETA
jgi:hypothetical protein